MKIFNLLLIGSGAREQALAKALTKNTKNNKIINLYNIGSHVNPGIANRINTLPIQNAIEIQIIPYDDLEKIKNFAQEKKIDLAIIGPEQPLELGLADALWEINIPVIGPRKSLAQIETSKGFARDLMKKYEINARPLYQRFACFNQEAEDFLMALNQNYVIKADGLMSGKGVKVFGDHLHSLKDSIQFCQEIDGPFVIEEKLSGPEFSLLSLSDGLTLAHMPAVQDHKRLLENDEGPNTGGMGTYTLANHRLNFLSSNDIQEAQKINEAVMQALQQETGESYQGILYGGFMKTASGIKVIEYNARFGDPEAINLLGLLKTDFLDICLAMINKTLALLNPIEFSQEASVCKYLVPEGYPEMGKKGDVLDLSFLSSKELENLYFSSLIEKSNQFIMQGSRAMAVLSIHPEIAQAEAQVEKIISKIQGNFYHRRDIGKIKKIRKIRKIAILGSTRGSILESFADLIKTQNLPIELSLLITDQADAPILERGHSLNIPSEFLSAKGLSREAYGENLNLKLQEKNIDLIILIGFMRILPSVFIKQWENKIINIHPSLLPKYAGLMDLEVHKAALLNFTQGGDQETGCTAHLVIEEVDAGKILTQKRCPILKTDTPESLKSKVQALEASALVEAVEILIKSTSLKNTMGAI